MWKHTWKGVRGALKDLLKILADCRWDAKRVTLFLCTRGVYYVPYSFLLISNKSHKGGGSGPSRAIKFLYAPAFVHKTTNAPMIYTALCIMFWMHAYPLHNTECRIQKLIYIKLPMDL